jgi:hypothetical protein
MPRLQGARSTTPADSDFRLKTWLNGKERGAETRSVGQQKARTSLPRALGRLQPRRKPKPFLGGCWGPHRAIPQRRRSPTKSDSTRWQRE